MQENKKSELLNIFTHKNSIQKNSTLALVWLAVCGFIFLSVPISTEAFYYFGGQVTIAPKAQEVITTESQGFICDNIGQSMTIRPVNPSYPHSYLIPLHIHSRTGHQLRSGAYVMGIYTGIVNIVCKKPTQHGDLLRIIPLPSVMLFGNSQ